MLTDIEGTTGSTAFVHDTLFPYARARLAAFVAHHAAEPAVAALLRETAREASEPDASPARCVEILDSWIAADRKITPLKTLQGLIWADGYRRGELRGHVYPDAVDGLRRWHAAGVGLYVYSSGSVAAQRLLFGYSVAGDLRPLFRDYFDTTAGPKDDAASYARIAERIGAAPARMVFLSDRGAELAAASAAGYAVAGLARPEDGFGSGLDGFPVAASFDDIDVAR